ncbi:DNA primase [Flavisolibacter ginsenosidimutans]|uniref:DNA primase n=1 Tax=Flavisolibacter ginsenosidimutans TaxID=661481 RepID=A0A5B8UE91_9BACT|nr:DNA primase [Flavisolibacter ginsenosidimutans]QEC54987.1 DNA primase [Flavisolibacter ginsenosidimutans]
MITQNTIQQILSRLDIVEVVGSFVKLKKRGANYLGNCPFHNERTPSFTVSPSKEIFKCFGCGKSGNTVSFLMEHEKLSYVEALRWLANRYNVEIEETETSPEQKQAQQTADSLFIINAFAQKFYAQKLLETEEGQTNGLSYLKERGFNKDIIQKFGLGYAPDGRDALTKEAIAAQYNSELLQKTGLVVERNGQLQDNYRDRIIFPIHNNSGKVIGFGARLIKKNDKAPKYINTPENELYVKSKLLYGTYFARQAIDKADECFLVEGYTDVLSLHQAGIENVVASGGTSLTQDQLRLIKKYTSNLTIIYDGDAAGVKAALRGLDMALEESLNVKLVLIPDGEDPDSYVRKVGEKRFREFVQENKKDFILFQLDVLLKDAGNDGAKKADVVNQVAETLSKIDKTEDFTKQQDYIRQCADTLKIDEAGFTALVNKFIRNRLASDKKLPFEEAQHFEENAKKAAVNEYDDNTYNLLFKDELQEREIARVLLEYGNREWENGELTAQYIFSELPEEDLFENESVLQILHEYKSHLESGEVIDKNFFVYHPDNKLSTFAVSLMQFKYEQSHHWKEELSQSTGYQKSLFQQDYKTFLHLVNRENAKELEHYLKIEEDRTPQEIISAITYLKLKKIKKLLIQNHADMEKASPSGQMTLFLTHQHLKQMEMELTSQLGSVIVK